MCGSGRIRGGPWRTFFPCSPCESSESLMTSIVFCCLTAACVPAMKKAVCGNLDLGPPRLSLTMSKLHARGRVRTGAEVSAVVRSARAVTVTVSQALLDPVGVLRGQAVAVDTALHRHVHVVCHVAERCMRSHTLGKAMGETTCVSSRTPCGRSRAPPLHPGHDVQA